MRYQKQGHERSMALLISVTGLYSAVSVFEERMYMHVLRDLALRNEIRTPFAKVHIHFLCFFCVLCI